MDLDFEATRRRADDRLHQELTRIRNLPKRSKITICNKHGLQHAHHMNTGLLKNLEGDLSILKREKRRVFNELNKKKREFEDAKHKSSYRLPGREVQSKKKLKQTHNSPRRFRASWGQRTNAHFSNQQETEKAQIRKDILFATAERSKRRTSQIIQQNIQIMDERTIAERNFLERLNRRQTLRKISCFPSLLGSPSPEHFLFRGGRPKADSFYKGTTYFMAEHERR